MAADLTPVSAAPVANVTNQEFPRTEAGQERAPRSSERGGRGGRGERNRNERPTNAEQAPAGDRAEPRADNRGERRPDRNRQPADGIRNDLSGNDDSGAMEKPTSQSTAAGSSQEQSQDVNETAARPESSGNREKRTRDRYGRDRAPRGERSEQGERQERPARGDEPVAEQVSEEPRRSYFTTTQDAAAPAVDTAPELQTTVQQTAMPAPWAEVAAPAPTPVVAQAAAETVILAEPQPKPAVVAAPIVVPVIADTDIGMPKVKPFVLSLGELSQVAQSSGLSWVNSDPAKIAAVQEAIAAEPKAIHVPRERLVIAPTQEGPLVLVETKRDLKNMTLPFEDKGVQ